MKFIFSRLWRIQAIFFDQGLFHLHCFMCFAIVYPYSVDVVEAAPEDHWSCWDMQTRGHHFCCTCVCSSGEYNNCATFFYNALGLNALPVPSLRQVYFFLFLRSFFLVRFLFVFFGGLGGASGGPWVDVVAIWGAFGGHFAAFLGVR